MHSLTVPVRVLFAFVVATTMALADDPKPSLQRPAHFDGTARVELDYLLALPEGYEERPSWPLLIFLHGSGERGDQLDRVKVHGPPKLIEAGQKFDFIVVSPQCPSYQWWQPAVLDAWLDQLTEELKIDKDRIYLTGLSMGGIGTWQWAAASPERFAAIVPICGRGDGSAAKRLVDIPTWVFHGAHDKAIPVVAAQRMVAAVEKAGGSPKLTIYPDAGHDSWTVTYDNPELYEWLLKQSRANRPK